MSSRDRFSFRKIGDLHWGLIFLITCVSCMGFAILYSAAQGNWEPWAMAQIKRFLVFFPIMLAIALIDIRSWLRYSYVFYVIALLMLIAVEISGHKAMGATRWMRIGPINIQPSEVMKIALILALARYFHFRSAEDARRIIYLIPPLCMIFLPVLLILKQPNLGTALICVLISGAIFFVAGIRLWKFGVVIGGALASIPIAWQFMHDYQKKRVLTFLDPERDPLGDGYNIIQSKIAIGSGGVTGKGFLHGSQSQLSFLPEHQTDFIFTMFAEEFGLVGGLTLLAAFTLIITLGYIIALRCHNHYGRIVATGITTMFFVHIFINIGMNMGLLPVVGTPLPLLSYGGSIMMTMLIGFGFLLNSHVHHRIYMNRGIEDD